MCLSNGFGQTFLMCGTAIKGIRKPGRAFMLGASCRIIFIIYCRLKDDGVSGGGGWTLLGGGDFGGESIKES
jgi:hypothetical protein